MLIYALTFMVVAGSLYALGPKEKRWLHLFLVSIYWLPATAAMVWVFLQVCKSSAVRYDQYFYCVDSSLFGAPSYAVGRLLQNHQWLNMASRWDYVLSIWCALALVLIAFAFMSLREAYWVTLSLFLQPVFATWIYASLPAAGPIYAFPSFPSVLPHVVHPHIVLIDGAAPNCFPSVHMSTALLCLYHLRRWRIGLSIGTIHVVLTALSTIGIGEHYFIDLIAAVPYAVFILWAARWVVDKMANTQEAATPSTMKGPRATPRETNLQT